MPRRFKVTVCYDIVTEESARDGDCAECRIDRVETLDLRGVVQLLESAVELSSWPIGRPEDCDGAWAIGEGSTDYRTGDERTESYHIEAKARDLYRIYRLSGLIGR